MKILKLSSYYAPEQISSSHLSKDLEEAYLNAGYTMEIYCPTPTRGISAEVRKQYKRKKYEEMKDGKIIVHRFSMFREGKNPIARAIRYVLINFAHYFKGCRAKGIDAIIAGSTPPTQGVLCAKVAKKLSKKYKKKVPFVYNLQDIFPDSLITTGLSKKGSLVWKIGRKIEDYTYRNADKIIVISESMKQNILEKGVPEEKIVIISNWIDIDATNPVPKSENTLYEEFGLSRDKFTVVYAGNFGAAQGADIVIQAADQLKDRNDIQFAIFGGGSGFEPAKTMVKEKGLVNVSISGLLPQERVSEVYSLGDVALITCKKGVGNSGMPSKTWSIMACNTPIIAAFDMNSDLARILENSGTGVCVPPEDASELAKVISNAADNADAASSNGREFVRLHASKESCTAKYVECLRSVTALNN